MQTGVGDVRLAGDGGVRPRWSARGRPRASAEPAGARPARSVCSLSPSDCKGCSGTALQTPWPTLLHHRSLLLVGGDHHPNIHVHPFLTLLTAHHLPGQTPNHALFSLPLHCRSGIVL